MNKKQKMISELIERIELASVELPVGDEYSGKMKLRAQPTYWDGFPEGHCRRSVFGDSESIESNLACLSEDTLSQILADDKIVNGMAWDALWRAWGMAKYFDCVPAIIYRPDSRLPVLRMRHDCYLHLFRGQGFQNSMDIVCDGSNGQSSMALNTYRGLINLPETSSLYDGLDYEERDAVERKWADEWKVFRTAMIYSLPFAACSGKRCFYQMLENDDGDLFDDFMYLTDGYDMRAYLDPDVGYKDIAMAARCTKPILSPLFEIPLIVCSKKGEWRVIAFLRYSEDCVSLTWSREAKQHHLALQFPKYDLAAYESELQALDLSCDCPSYASERDYYYYIWTALSTVLFTISPISAGPYYFGLRESFVMDSAPITLYNKESCAGGTACIDSLTYDYCKRFRTLRDYKSAATQVPEMSEIEVAEDCI